MRRSLCVGAAFGLFISSLMLGCGDGGDGGGDYTPPPNLLANPSSGPPAGNPDGGCQVPAEAWPEDVTSPDHVVGTGTPGSCTPEAFIDAVGQGGTIVFDCGSDPVTITLSEPARVFNDQDPDVVIDGGGLVTLSGGGSTRILYMNTCDPDQVWTTSHCQNQDHPRLTVQNLTFADGNSRNESESCPGSQCTRIRAGRSLTRSSSRADRSGDKTHDGGRASRRRLKTHGPFCCEAGCRRVSASCGANSSSASGGSRSLGPKTWKVESGSTLLSRSARTSRVWGGRRRGGRHTHGSC